MTQQEAKLGAFTLTRLSAMADLVDKAKGIMADAWPYRYMNLAFDDWLDEYDRHNEWVDKHE